MTSASSRANRSFIRAGTDSSPKPGSNMAIDPTRANTSSQPVMSAESQFPISAVGNAVGDTIHQRSQYAAHERPRHQQGKPRRVQHVDASERRLLDTGKNMDKDKNE